MLLVLHKVIKIMMQSALTMHSYAEVVDDDDEDDDEDDDDEEGMLHKGKLP